jgi:hypothetical protein
MMMHRSKFWCYVMSDDVENGDAATDDDDDINKL